MLVQDEIKFMSTRDISKFTESVFKQYQDDELKRYIEVIDAQVVMKMKKLQAEKK
jgi:hypothetical protein